MSESYLDVFDRFVKLDLTISIILVEKNSFFRKIVGLEDLYEPIIKNIIILCFVGISFWSIFFILRLPLPYCLFVFIPNLFIILTS